MIYSGDNWPDKYRNTFFTINTHGNRINNDILKRSGSGYVATHGACRTNSNMAATRLCHCAPAVSSRGRSPESRL